MKRNIKRLFCTILLIFVLSSISIISNAALDYSITSGISNIDQGKTYTISIKATGLTGRFNITHSSNVSVSCSSIWVENGVPDTTITVTANSAGEATVTVSPESVASAETGELVTLSSKTDRVTIEAKEENTDNTTSDNNTNNENKTNTDDNKKEDPTFTSKNETVYATDEVNVRSSYSTSSTILGSLKTGDSITRTGIGSNGWSKVSYNGKTAYVNSSYLTTTKPVEQKEDKEEKKENEKSNNKNLKSLVVTPTGLSPEFDKNKTEYAMTVKSDVSTIKVEAVAEDKNAKVSISGNKDLKVGDNTITIKVTAEDETVRTYKILVTKESKEQVVLDELLIEGVALQPKFDSSTYKYNVTLEENSDISKLNITASPNNKDATVEIVGNENLKVGNNVITILVKTDDDKITTYQINVEILQKNVEEKKEKNDSELYKYIAIGVLGAIVIIAIIIVIAKYRNNNETDDEMDDLYDEEDNLESEMAQNKNVNKERKPFIDVNDNNISKSSEEEENQLNNDKEVEKSESDISRSSKLDELYANSDVKTERRKGKHF